MTVQRIEKLKTIYNRYTSRKFFAMLDACVHCGACADACHYYCSENNPDYIPANRILKLKKIISGYFHPVKSRIGMGSTEDPMNNPDFDTLYDTAFQNCTLCAKCALTCPMGINTGEIMYVARALLFGLGKVPSGLVSPVETTLATGNYLGLSTEDFVETMEWLAEEMEEDMGEGFSIPIDKPNAAVLYIPHPLTLRDLPFLLMDEIKILAASGEDYTLSTHDFDTVNYAYYQGSWDNTLTIADSTFKAREKIAAASLALAPCGHGYRVMRREVEKMRGQLFDFPIFTLVELIEKYVRQGKLTLEKDRFEGPVTYHDPCNIARIGGVVEAPRTVIKALTSDFVEMEPHGVHNFCCGGGGGLASTGDFGKVRMKMGRAKAEQIKNTDARTVVTGCFNCKNQIRDLGKEYDLGIKVKSIVEVVAGSIV